MVAFINTVGFLVVCVCVCVCAEEEKVYFTVQFGRVRVAGMIYVFVNSRRR